MPAALLERVKVDDYERLCRGTVDRIIRRRVDGRVDREVEVCLLDNGTAVAFERISIHGICGDLSHLPSPGRRLIARGEIDQTVRATNARFKEIGLTERVSVRLSPRVD